MTDARTLPDVILGHALAAPDREAFRFVTARHEVRERLSYAQLLARARTLAVELDGIEPGSRVPLVFAPGLSFIVALLACWLARVIAVPLAPEGFRRDAPGRRRLLQDIEADFALCDETLTIPEVDHPLRWLRASAAGRGAQPTLAPMPVLDPDDIALLQFTSGSTSAPRGVAITHANLMANMRMIRQAFGHGSDTTVVGWAPLHHDQGLIGNVLQPLYLGSRCVLFSAQTFVRDPLLWLELICDHRAHTSGGPNFAYDLCAARYNAARLETIDLKSWQIAFNGAEPVHAQTVARFSKCFAPHGFDLRSIYPCYGLAEATLFASGGPGRRMPVTRRAHSRAGSREPVRIGCGRAAEGTRILIVDEAGLPCAPLEIGEIWISGAHVSAGYWRDATAGIFRARLDDGEYLRTGDLGFLDDSGELFPAGRIKELIIQHGRNFAPHDIENTVAAASVALDPYRGVVFSIEVEGREQIIAVHEIARRARRAASPDDIVRAVRKQVAAVHDLTLQQVLLVEPLTIPLTTSGKKQRARVRAEFLAGTLATVNHDALA